MAGKKRPAGKRKPATAGRPAISPADVAAGYAPGCKACNSLLREEIDRRLLNGESPRKVAEWLDEQGDKISRSALVRHLDGHVSGHAETVKTAAKSGPAETGPVGPVVDRTGPDTEGCAKWSSGLNLRQRRFVLRYVRHGNATRAYREAGYESRNADVDGPALLRNPGVREAIERLALRTEMQAEVSISECLTRYNRRAKANVADFIQTDGEGHNRIKPLNKLPRHKTAAVHKIKTEETWTEEGRKVKTTLELYNAKDSDDAIMKHLGGFVERKEISGPGGGPVETQEVARRIAEDPEAATLAHDLLDRICAADGDAGGTGVRRKRRQVAPSATPAPPERSPDEGSDH